FEGRLRNPGDGCGGLAGGIEGDEHLLRPAVLDELDPPEAAQTAPVADRRMPLREGAERLTEIGADGRGILDDALLLERLDRRDRRGARERMARARQPAGEGASAHLVDDLT